MKRKSQLAALVAAFVATVTLAGFADERGAPIFGDVPSSV